MLIYFNENGVLKEQLDSYGNLPRVGSQYFKIFAYFENIDLNNYGAAYIRLQRPDISDSEYPVLFMVQADLDYENGISDSPSEYFTPDGGPNIDHTYPCYMFDFSSIMDIADPENSEDDHIVTLLDTPGQWQATITLISTTTGATNVVGTISFNVDGAVDIEEETEITFDIVTHNMATAIAQKLQASSTYYFRTIDDFETAASAKTLPAAVTVPGAVVFDRNNQTFYRISTVITNLVNFSQVGATYTKIVDLNDKLNIADGILVVPNVSYVDLSKYVTGQLFYSRNDETYYRKNSSGEAEKAENVGILGARNALVRYVVPDDGTDIKIGEIPFLISSLERSVIVNFQSHDYIMQVELDDGVDYYVTAFDAFGHCFYSAYMDITSDYMSDLIVPDNRIDHVVRKYTPNSLYGVDANGHQVNFLIDDILEDYIKYFQVPDYQTTVSVIANILTNINGWELTNFNYTEVTAHDYPAYKIVTTDNENLTKAKARVYLRAMTGSEYLPEYSFEKPSNTFLVLPDGTILKPQWDNSYGLLLYKMKRFADVDYVDNNILTLSTTSGTLTSDQLGYALKKNARIFVSANNTYFEKSLESSTQIFFLAINADFTVSNGIVNLQNNSNLLIDKITREYSIGRASIEFYNKAKMDADFATKDYVGQAIEAVKRNAFKNVDTTEYPTLDDFLDDYPGEEGYVYLYPINISDLDEGYYQYIWEDIDGDEQHEWQYLGTTKIDLSDITVVFRQETFDDGVITVDFSSNTDIQLISLINAVSVDFVIPQDISQGWISSCTFELGSTVPTFSLTNNSSYNVVFIVNNVQVNSISSMPSNFLGNSIVEALAECNGFNIRIYMKEARV